LRWDPFFRTEKEIERKHWDPEYRQRLHEEKRMSSQWLEAYYENPTDPVLRQRYESMYGVDIYGRKSWWSESQGKRR